MLFLLLSCSSCSPCHVKTTHCTRDICQNHPVNLRLNLAQDLAHLVCVCIFYGPTSVQWTRMWSFW